MCSFHNAESGWSKGAPPLMVSVLHPISLCTQGIEHSGQDIIQQPTLHIGGPHHSEAFQLWPPQSLLYILLPQFHSTPQGWSSVIRWLTFVQLSLHASTASFLKLEFPVPKDGSPTTLKISIEHFTTWAYFKSKTLQIFPLSNEI